jgi:hypothetical protein
MCPDRGNLPILYAAGAVDITPERPLPLAGYAGRSECYTGVADALEANVLVCRDAHETVVMVAFDLLHVGELLRQKLQAALAEVRPEQLFLTASHTHFAPATDPTTPGLGQVDEDYVALVADRTAGLVRKLLRMPGQPMLLGTGRCATSLSVNRRLAGWRITGKFPFVRHGVWMAPNPAGPVDRHIQVARIGTDVVLWTFACHPSFLPQMSHVSADFPGFVRAALRRALGEHTTVLFWQGFSGDVFPSFVASMKTVAGRIQRKLLSRAEVVRAEVWQRWATTLAGQVIAAVRGINSQESAFSLACRRSEIPAEALVPGSATGKRIRAHRVDLGAALRVVGISAEMVVEYLPVFEGLFGPGPLFCVSCMDGVIGYVPTAQMLSEGGYEVDGFRAAFGLAGQFHVCPEQLLRERLLLPLAGLFNAETAEIGERDGERGYRKKLGTQRASNAR